MEGLPARSRGRAGSLARVIRRLERDDFDSDNSNNSGNVPDSDTGENERGESPDVGGQKTDSRYKGKI